MGSFETTMDYSSKPVKDSIEAPDFLHMPRSSGRIQFPDWGLAGAEDGLIRDGVLGPLEVDFGQEKSGPSESKLQNFNPQSSSKPDARANEPYSEEETIKAFEMQEKDYQFTKTPLGTYSITMKDGTEYAINENEGNSGADAVVCKVDESGQLVLVENEAEAKAIGDLVADFTGKEQEVKRLFETPLTEQEKVLFTQIFEAMQRGDWETTEKLAGSYTSTASWGRVFSHLAGNSNLTGENFDLSPYQLVEERRSIRIQ